MASSLSPPMPMTPETLQPYDILYEDIYRDLPSGCHVWKEDFPIVHCPGRPDSAVFEYKGMAIKRSVHNREMDIAVRAGDCAVEVLGYVMKFDVPGGRRMGLVMEKATPLVEYLKTIGEPEKPRIKREMIAIVERLHANYRQIHGDIKPANFVLCKDGVIRLCDFEASRPIDEPPERWEEDKYNGDEATFTHQYGRSRSLYSPPTLLDDKYALALSIWELYTGQEPLLDFLEPGTEEMDEFLVAGGTVDLTKVKDLETREWIRKHLKEGGAAV
ncbi:hypothetical protein AA313_de0204869 [Arthrobotrys entomopaga]|nr:hypothetical protein AA313_de0204869 [Arthrobotrys entomopaga]